MSSAKCLLSLMVLLVATACVAHAQERIKMCGRELVRLAISSCGNARIRRSIPNAGPELPGTSNWEQDVSAVDHQASETTGVPPQSDGEEDVLSWASHWYPMSSRVRRAAGKMSDICCEKGCSIRELIQFC